MAWPSNPTNGQQITVGGILYQYSSALGVWNKVQLAAPTFISDGAVVSVSGSFTAPGNISGNYILGNGALLTGVGVNSYGNANVAEFLPTYTGNISTNNLGANVVNAQLNIISQNTISAVGNLQA